jgi:hypothetical protein
MQSNKTTKKKSPLLEGMSFLSGVVGDSNLFYCFIGQRTPGFSGIGFGFLRILIQTYNPSHCSAIGTIPDYDERLHLIFGKLPLKEIRRITYQKGKE